MTLLLKGKYDDFDGLSIVFDPDAIRERYGAPRDAFHTSPHDDLLPLRAAGEALAFGTRAGGTFALRIQLGARHELDLGVLRTTGRIGLAGWHTFTFACEHGGGVVEERFVTEVRVEAGTYRASVTRTAARGDDQVFRAIAIGLEPTDAKPAPAPDGTIPGADGMF